LVIKVVLSQSYSFPNSAAKIQKLFDYTNYMLKKYK